MIDDACGVGSKPPVNGVLLRCPKCRKEKQSYRDKIDPAGTAVIEMPCPACNPDGFEDCPRYFDAAGKRITPDWATP